MHPFSTAQFDYIGEIREFVADASSLGLNKMPKTLTLTSTRTGAEETFRLHQVHRDEGEEVTGWRFVAASHPKLSVLIVNT